MSRAPDPYTPELTSELERRIHDAVAAIPGIAVLLLFGSWARGTARASSDLDIAVLPTGDAAAMQAGPFGLEAKIAGALTHLSPHPEHHVDVVRLDRAPDTLRQRVMEHGKMILCRDPDAWKALRVRTMKEYGDRLPWRRIYIRGLKRRLTERRPHGRPTRAGESPGRARRISP